MCQIFKLYNSPLPYKPEFFHSFGEGRVGVMFFIPLLQRLGLLYLQPTNKNF